MFMLRTVNRKDSVTRVVAPGVGYTALRDVLHSNVAPRLLRVRIRFVKVSNRSGDFPRVELRVLPMELVGRRKRVC